MPKPTAPSPRQANKNLMSPQPAETADPFDLDFDAETEFVSSPQDAKAAPDPHDPFAGLSSPRPVDDNDPVHAAPTPAPNPIADMLASAEAALGEHTVPRI